MTETQVARLEKQLNKFSDKGKDARSKVDTLINLAFEYNRSELEKTRQYANQAAVLAEKLVHKKGIALSNLMLSLYHRLRGDFDEGLELSTPTIRIWEGVLIVPLIGVLDSRRAQRLTEELLTAISSTQSKIAIIDITGVPAVDSTVVNHLLKTVESVKLLGAECVITGIKPDVAQTIIHLGIDIVKLETRAKLADGLKWAFNWINKE